MIVTLLIAVGCAAVPAAREPAPDSAAELADTARVSFLVSGMMKTRSGAT